MNAEYRNTRTGETTGHENIAIDWRDSDRAPVEYREIDPWNDADPGPWRPYVADDADDADEPPGEPGSPRLRSRDAALARAAIRNAGGNRTMAAARLRLQADDPPHGPDRDGYSRRRRRVASHLDRIDGIDRDQPPVSTR